MFRLSGNLGASTSWNPQCLSRPVQELIYLVPLNVRSWKFFVSYMIYLLTAIGLSPGGSNTVHIYTQTIHRTTQNKQYIEQQQFGKVRAVPRRG